MAGGDEPSPWPCKRRGAVKQVELSYNGWYERTVVFEEGSVRVRIPRLRCCRCSGSVSADLGPMLRKRQRHWYDSHLTIMEQYTNGVSYRGLRRSLHTGGVYVGLSSLPRVMGEARSVSSHAQPVGNRLLAAQADGTFWWADGQMRAILCLLHVRPRTENRSVGRHILRFETGQVVASVIATEESGQYWQMAMEEVYWRAWLTERHELFSTSDGNEGIQSAAQTLFWLRTCSEGATWHIAHRARLLTPTLCGTALEKNVSWVFNASGHDELR